MLAVNLLNVLVFSLVQFDSAPQAQWARRIALAHGAMAVVMLVFAGWARRALAVPGLSLSGRWLAPVASVLALGWSLVLVYIDQSVGMGVNAYIVASVGAAIIFLFD